MKITGLTGLIIGAVMFLIVGIILLTGCVSSYNTELGLRKQVEAKAQERDIVFDNTWKIIQQQAQVSSKYAEDFKQIYPALMGERYKEGEAQLAKLVVEANPNFDTRLYEKLMGSIEVQRTIFTRTQKELIDLDREHDYLVSRFPTSILFGILGVGETNITVITSDRTRDASTTGVDNDVKVF